MEYADEECVRVHVYSYVPVQQYHNTLPEEEGDTRSVITALLCLLYDTTLLSLARSALRVLSISACRYIYIKVY